MNSEITITKNESATPSRSPVSISGSAAGRIDAEEELRGPRAEALRGAESSGSIWRTAWTVVRNIGKNVA